MGLQADRVGHTAGNFAPMDWLGGVAVVAFLVLVGPFSLFVGGMLWSALFGFAATEDAEDRHPDSELVKYRSW